MKSTFLLYGGAQNWTQYSRGCFSRAKGEGENHLHWPAGNALPKAAQAGCPRPRLLLGHILTSHAQLVVYQDLQSMFCQATLQPGVPQRVLAHKLIPPLCRTQLFPSLNFMRVLAAPSSRLLRSLCTWLHSNLVCWAPSRTAALKP